MRGVISNIVQIVVLATKSYAFLAVDSTFYGVERAVGRDSTQKNGLELKTRELINLRYATANIMVRTFSSKGEEVEHDNGGRTQ